MQQRAYFIHALSPLHPGTGQAQGAIDLPIARLRGTGIPFLPGSSIKGVLRDAFTNSESGESEANLLYEVFGPPVELSEEDKRFSGAVAFGDARLIALPIRSFQGTFAWVTSPLLLRLARRDLDWPIEIPGATAPIGRTWIGVTETSVLAVDRKVFLEEIDCPVRDQEQRLVTDWADDIAKLVLPEDSEMLTERFAVVDDETMTFLWESCTQIDARIRIDQKRGVVQEGALWYEESLPAETLLLGVAVVVKRDPKPERLLDYCLAAERSDLQFGGKATVGRGRARLVPCQHPTPSRQGGRQL
jgi:CRISPR-associated protein Cmr4